MHGRLCVPNFSVPTKVQLGFGAPMVKVSMQVVLEDYVLSKMRPITAIVPELRPGVAAHQLTSYDATSTGCVYPSP